MSARRSAVLRALIVRTPPTLRRSCTYRRNTVHAEPATLPLSEAPMPPFQDGVQASSVAQTQACPGAIKTARDLLLLGSAVHDSPCNTSLQTSPIPQQDRGAVQAPSDEDRAAASAATISCFSFATAGFACAPDSAAELLDTISSHFAQG
ncbi:hypothetical protein HPB50_017050 [Hyalomma asiaticum]|uniref:Uncharacterized protein n=1 Tax=Hyalomma asiaticum TaxID=266040 RepID=A0ACB7TLR1_HYAAI|nr:hypothetical protein HPB50_017050 [Hyalomma asiaticum]